MERETKEFGDTGVDDVHKEMKYIHYSGVPIPVEPHKLYSVSKAAAVKYLILLNMKQGGKIKGRGCADGRSQRSYTHKY